MQGSVAAAGGAYAFGAATWPLVAGLSLVLWSKARAWRAAVRVRAR